MPEWRAILRHLPPIVRPALRQASNLSSRLQTVSFLYAWTTIVKEANNL